MMSENEKIETNAVLVSMVKTAGELKAAEESLKELQRLLETAGGNASVFVTQVKDTVDVRTYIGSGKVKEISEICHRENIPLVIFDNELSPSQIANLEEEIKDVTVLDRSMLILDIFALHATSGEGKLQVELAQLRYTAPRLIGKGRDLSRQGGGIGSRGPGESKLESDKRHLQERIRTLQNALKQMEHDRSVMRRQRDGSGLPKVAIVGYTNAGKSTLLNYLTGAGVLSEDKLFATLDPTTRRLTLPSGQNILLTDTVGFIKKLPHHLVEAFKSTLDEVRYADLLMIVSDVSDEEMEHQREVTLDVVEELGAKDKPVLFVYNKCDMLSDVVCSVPTQRSACISAKTGLGVDNMLAILEEMLKESKKNRKLLFPYDKQSEMNRLFKEYQVLSQEYTEDGVLVFASLDAKGMGKYAQFLLPGESNDD